MIQNGVLVERHKIPDQNRVSPSAVTWEANALMSKIVQQTMNGNYVSADVEAAIRADMTPILVTWANSEEKEKAPEGTIILNSPSELLPILDLS
ncbi:MAG: hypothetical protein BAJATHORv1_40131 [Candidatus Thorarchaeota archaeon]|nr:MAG: hypothetical protein BAJATHORv1_40131 [Candidatus Thorarchaeota archaeon]